MGEAPKSKKDRRHQLWLYIVPFLTAAVAALFFALQRTPASLKDGVRLKSPERSPTSLYPPLTDGLVGLPPSERSQTRVSETPPHFATISGTITPKVGASIEWLLSSGERGKAATVSGSYSIVIPTPARGWITAQARDFTPKVASFLVDTDANQRIDFELVRERSVDVLLGFMEDDTNPPTEGEWRVVALPFEPQIGEQIVGLYGGRSNTYGIGRLAASRDPFASPVESTAGVDLYHLGTIKIWSSVDVWIVLCRGSVVALVEPLHTHAASDSIVFQCSAANGGNQVGSVDIHFPDHAITPLAKWFNGLGVFESASPQDGIARFTDIPYGLNIFSISTAGTGSGYAIIEVDRPEMNVTPFGDAPARKVSLSFVDGKSGQPIEFAAEAYPISHSLHLLPNVQVVANRMALSGAGRLRGPSATIKPNLLLAPGGRLVRLESDLWSSRFILIDASESKGVTVPCYRWRKVMIHFPDEARVSGTLALALDVSGRYLASYPVRTKAPIIMKVPDVPFRVSLQNAVGEVLQESRLQFETGDTAVTFQAW